MTDPPDKFAADFAPADLRENYMRALYDYWRAARGEALMPPVSAIDPMQLPRTCLPYLAVLDVVQSPLRLRSRLNGTALVQQLGVDQTGRWLDELPGIGPQLARMEWCVRERRPYIAESGVTFAPHDYKRYQILVLPFGDPDHGVLRLVCVFAFLDGGEHATRWTRR